MIQGSKVEIYVPLLDEGTEVWRPVEAIKIGEGIYRIVSDNQKPDDELWKYVTGDIVRCIRQMLSSGFESIVAIEKIE